MSNMNYCQFENTMNDMQACLWAFQESEKTSERECEKAEYMFEEILRTMMDFGILDEYDGDLLHDFCQEMNENKGN